MADVDTPFVQQILNVPQGKGKPHIHHHRQAEDLGAGPEVAKRAGFGHHAKLRDRNARLKIRPSDSTGRINRCGGSPLPMQRHATGTSSFFPLSFRQKVTPLSSIPRLSGSFSRFRSSTLSSDPDLDRSQTRWRRKMREVGMDRLQPGSAQDLGNPFARAPVLGMEKARIAA